jgi:4-carboxymuconolactone decarboxylase
MNDDERYEAGMNVRRAVLGDAHVERSLANRTELTEEFQNFITRYAWGEIWTREGLPRHTRSLVTIERRTRAASARGEEQWRDPRRDQGGAAADRDLLRRAGG